ncbi:MAG: protein kinase, partial [Planctomycetes bacterium]|nr:protein kinase [Planctomycetota bacterium]
MPSDVTQFQSEEDRRRARELSLKKTSPPCDVPGYETQQFLGSGAYGEVWVGVDQNTGRRVAIKFYTHRSSVDWMLLSREVEKLAVLSADRYVVQLLDVGWDADPPYYVMDYIENGSLEDALKRDGPFAVHEAVEFFQEVSIGLMHLHSKGVLHCDLKPANVLLDEDSKPRLADFGQSRLSDEQLPALGTLFYMAPEQADMEAVPDAKWDVYALGALLYCMLTGEPPFRTEKVMSEVDSGMNLGDRLARYRTAIADAPRPQKHRQVAGIDRALVDVIDRCLAVDPRRRFASVQSVLEALEARVDARARKPLLILGVAAPIALLVIMAIFAWQCYVDAISDSKQAIEQRAKLSNDFASQFAAEQVAGRIQRYFRAVEQVAEDANFRELFSTYVQNELIAKQFELLANSNASGPEFERLQSQFVRLAERQKLQTYVETLLNHPKYPVAASWFVCDAAGTQIAAIFDQQPKGQTIGRNYGWRTYFHGSGDDLRPGPGGLRFGTPKPEQRITETHLSAAFESTATNTWKVAISTPIYIEDQFAGVLALTVDIGKFMKFNNRVHQYAVLVDGRSGRNEGVILHHPLFTELMKNQAAAGKPVGLPARFKERRYRIALAEFDK